jgi:hypothetical protein
VRKGARNEGREGCIVAPQRKKNFQYPHTNLRILPNEHLTKTANNIPRHYTLTHKGTHNSFVYSVYLMTLTIQAVVFTSAKCYNDQ